METATVVLIVVAVLVLGAFAFWYIQRRRSKLLRERFGPEYERTVAGSGNRRKAEQVLESRQKRVARYQIRPLAPGDRDRFAESWHDVQSQFVDDPNGAVARADQLVGDVLHLRGYPVTDFWQRAEDISVDHPVVVENYRAAHDIAVRRKRGEASTEDLRQAMVYYRTLFEELLGAGETVHTEVK